MARKATVVTERYLRTIYKLQEEKGVARTGELVRLLHVAPGTVTNTVKRLKEQGLLIREPYKGVKLTEEGFKVALRGIRRHRLAERLLTDILHVEWERAHKAACELECGISDKIMENLEEALGHPETCPHGNPIPTRNGKVTEEKARSLADLNPQESGVIIRVTEEKQDTLKYLATLGLKPGTLVGVIEKGPLEDLITVKILGKCHALSQKVASIIKVKIQEGKRR